MSTIKKSSKFKTGDIVRVLIDRPCGAELEKGDVVTVLDDKTQSSLRVSGIEGRKYNPNWGWAVNYDQLEHVEKLEHHTSESKTPLYRDTKKDKFKIGDIVEVTGNGCGSINKPGDKGVIITKSGPVSNPNGYQVKVEGRKNTSNWHAPCELKLAKQESYIPSTQIKQINMNALAITDLSQIKAICELLPGIKAQVKASNPEVYAELFPEPIKVGSRFKNDEGERFILAHESNAVALVNLKNGSITTPTIRVNDINNITSDELDEISGDENITLHKRA